MDCWEFLLVSRVELSRHITCVGSVMELSRIVRILHPQRKTSSLLASRRNRGLVDPKTGPLVLSNTFFSAFSSYPTNFTAVLESAATARKDRGLKVLINTPLDDPVLCRGSRHIHRTSEDGGPVLRPEVTPQPGSPLE